MSSDATTKYTYALLQTPILHHLIREKSFDFLLVTTLLEGNRQVVVIILTVVFEQALSSHPHFPNENCILFKQTVLRLNHIDKKIGLKVTSLNVWVVVDEA